MRTTITLDDDVLGRARTLASVSHETFRRVINEALRAGLDVVAKPTVQKPYRTRPHKMGLREGVSLDRIQDVLSQFDGEEYP